MDETNRQLSLEIDGINTTIMTDRPLPARIGGKVNNICGECKYFGVVTDKQMDVCKHKDSNQNVVEYDTRACKHYEKWERRD